MNAHPWIAYDKPRADANLRLLCFPCAGGSAALFRTWADTLPERIDDTEVRSHDLAGWREQTGAFFTLHLFPGDHFYLRHAQGSLLRRIIQELSVDGVI